MPSKALERPFKSLLVWLDMRSSESLFQGLGWFECKLKHVTRHCVECSLITTSSQVSGMIMLSQLEIEEYGKCSCLACLVTRGEHDWHIPCVRNTREARKKAEIQKLVHFFIFRASLMIYTCLDPKSVFLFTWLCKKASFQHFGRFEELRAFSKVIWHLQAHFQGKNWFFLPF